MFEGLTLEIQRQLEQARGWKPTYSALTYCTSECVVYRGSGSSAEKTILDGIEILIGTRISGVPDCLGKRQGKWGSYVKPTDDTALHSAQRALSEAFGWTLDMSCFDFAGIIGPRLTKSMMMLEKNGDGEVLSLGKTSLQAESTPFEGKVFWVNATGCEVGPEGGHVKAVNDVRWITLRELINTEGNNENFLYWEMVAMCIKTLTGPHPGQGFCKFNPGVNEIITLI